MRNAAVTVRLPGARTAPATNSKMFCQVGRVNSLGKSVSRNSRRSGRGDSHDGEVGSGCCILAACRTEFYRLTRGTATIPLGSYVGVGAHLTCTAKARIGRRLAVYRQKPLAPPLQGGAKGEQPFDVPGHGDKAPLAPHTVQPTQQKLP